MKDEMGNLQIELRGCLQALRRNVVVICLFAALGLLLASLTVIVPRPDIYQATGSISKTTTSGYGTLSIDMFGDLIYSKNVLDEVVGNLGGRVKNSEELASMLSTSSNESQNILYISAAHEDASLAMEVTNITTDVMARQINEIYNAGVVVLDQATSTRLMTSGAATAMLFRVIGAIAGAILCCAVIVIRAMTSKKAMGVDACTLDGEYELIGVIPYVVFEE